VAHPSARLSVFSRQLLVKRVLVDGWPVATVAEQPGISRATGYKWVRRYRTDGLAGLEDRGSRPHRSPRRLPDEATTAIVRARARRRYGPARLAPLTGHPRSTIYGVLRRAGMSRLRDADRVTGAPVRYVACHPGALVHQDHKKPVRSARQRQLARTPPRTAPRSTA
jgi:transposase